MSTTVLTVMAALSVTLAAQQPPTFRTVTDLVEVDVVVQEKSGRFVTDLKPEEFELREDGDSQKIEVFYVVDGGKVVEATPAAGAQREAAGRPAPQPAQRTFVAFFDTDHLTTSGFKRVQAAALSLFDKQFRSGDIGGVVSEGQMANGRLTSDREELLKAVRNARPNTRVSSRRFDEQTWPRLNEVQAVRIVVNNDRTILAEAIARACADDPTLCNNAELAVRGKAAQLADEARAMTAQTAQRLVALFNGLARIDGRKTVLLLSEGFLSQESWPIVKDAIGQAARANARIYTLDARGLDRAGMAASLAGGHESDSGMSALMKQFDMAADSVNSLAVDTGGFVVRNTNIFDKALEQIVADANTYYVLGYRPSRPLDGKFRSLAVKTTRPGLSVRARRGYLATPKPVAAPTPTDAARGSTGSPRAAETADPIGPPAPDDSARPELEGRASTATVVPRTRPSADKHVEALAPTRPGDDADASAGWAAYQRGDLEAARASLLKAAAGASPHSWVFYALGQSQYALQQYHDAAVAWEGVRASDPDFKPVYFDLVDAYLQLKDYDKAARVLRDGERRWRRDAELLNALGVVQVTRGALDDAMESFARAIDAAPQDGTGYFNLGKAYELKYWKYRRYVSQTRQWMANGHDRNKAIENYKRYLEIGGPFENAVRDGLSRLNWSSP